MEREHKAFEHLAYFKRLIELCEIMDGKMSEVHPRYDEQLKEVGTALTNAVRGVETIYEAYSHQYKTLLAEDEEKHGDIIRKIRKGLEDNTMSMTEAYARMGNNASISSYASRITNLEVCLSDLRGV